MKTYKVVNEKPNIVFIKDKVIDDYYRINPESYDISFLKKDETLQNNTLVSLEEITSFISHVTGFETEKYIRYVENGKGFIRIVNLEEFFINLQDIRKIPDESYNILFKYHLRAGDILLSKDGTIGRAALVNDSLGEAIGSSHVVTIRIEEDKIDPHYVVTFINSAYGQFQCSKFSTGSIQKALNVEKIRKLQVPIPSSKIQKYIGDKVRKAEILREEAKIKRDNAKNLFEHSLKIDINYEAVESDKFSWVENITIENITGEYYKTLYIELEEKIKELGIELRTIEEISNGVMIGNTKKISDNYSDEGIPYLTTKNIKAEGVDFSSLLYIPDEIHNNELKKSKVYPNDILYNKSGNVGLSALLGDKYKEYNVVSDIIVIRPKHELIDPSYLVMYLNSQLGKKASERMAGGAIFKHISIYDVNKINIPLLPYEQQVIIGNKIREAENLNETSKQLIQEAKKDVEDLIEGNFDMSKLNQP